MGSGLRCAVIGAANIDIGGFPLGRLSLQDSTPGRVVLSAGGVGHNIACNLARLGVQTRLITALGTDAFADITRADCARCGVDTSLSPVFEGAASSTYLFIADAGGDMQLAVNDMAVCDRLTPQVLESRLDALNAMDAVVLDANLPAETLAFLAGRVKAPLIADTVSTAKAPRLIGALGRLDAVKPNAIEAETLTGIPVHGADSALRAARALVDMGVRRAYITLGEKGACCADREGARFLPGAALRLVNATGAGDAFTAALAWATLRGLSLAECGIAGLAAASVCAESLETVSPEINEETVLGRMKQYKEAHHEQIS